MDKDRVKEPEAVDDFILSLKHILTERNHVSYVCVIDIWGEIIHDLGASVSCNSKFQYSWK
jgi:hypothetical protein